jgi:hypothetical protein
MKRPWIKLYLEILDDEKLEELPEPACWRFVQLTRNTPPGSFIRFAHFSSI